MLAGMSDTANADTRTRDHLANERTYLAWLRTAANVMVVGLAVARFVADSGAMSLLAGGILVVVGAAGVAYGTIRYRGVSADIEAGRWTRTGRTVAVVVASSVLVVALLGSLVLVVLGRR